MKPLSEKDKATLRALIAESMDGVLTPDDQARLEAILQGNRAAQEYYIECLGLYTDLYDLAGSEESQKSGKSMKGKGVRTLFSPFSPFSPFKRHWWAAAAVLVLGLWFVWQSVTVGPEIGTVVDTLDLQAGWSFPKRPGQRLRQGPRKMRIKTGIAHLRLDRGVDLVLEGPCTFQLVSPTTLALKQGRLYARVGAEGRGFTVETANTKIVDLGTEFGVVSHGVQGAEVHVLAGEVEVGPKSLGSGEALRINGQGQTTKDIACNAQAFVRRIDSNVHLAWRGQTALDLADIVAGGDGFGTGQTGCEINPLTGRFGPIANEAYDRRGNRRYNEVAALPLVDGVFVPDGSSRPVPVTSAGHEFAECPDTCNIFFAEVLSCSMTFKGEIEGRRRGLILNGIEYGNGARPGIFMHANLGLSFNLRRIRDALGPDVTIERFQSVAGISEATNMPELGDADIWVLIDGRVAYARHHAKVGQAQPVDLPIDAEAQFLTLVTTDGQSDNGEFVETMADWCTFGEPRLILQTKE